MSDPDEPVALVWLRLGDTIKVVTPDGNYVIIVVDWVEATGVLLLPDGSRRVAIIDGTIERGQPWSVQYVGEDDSTDLGVVTSTQVTTGQSEAVRAVVEADHTSNMTVIADALLVAPNIFGEGTQQD